MRYNYRHRLRPPAAIEERLAWRVDTCRQVYHHFLHRLRQVETDRVSGRGALRLANATGRPCSEGGTFPFKAVREGPKTEPASRVLAMQKAAPFTTGKVVTFGSHTERFAIKDPA